MGYQECYKETNELAAERYELVAERIAEIAEAAQAPEPFAEYFRTNAAYLQSLRALYEKGKSGILDMIVRTNISFFIFLQSYFHQKCHFTPFLQ